MKSGKYNQVSLVSLVIEVNERLKGLLAHFRGGERKPIDCGSLIKSACLVMSLLRNIQGKPYK